MSISIPIIGLTMMIGYFLNKDSKNKLAVNYDNSIKKNIEGFERSNGSNIYESNMVNEVTEEMLQRSKLNYELSKSPSDTGILPPIYNSYSLESNGTINNNVQGQLNYINKVSDIKANSFKPVIQNRPMFTEQSSIINSTERNYADFSSGELQIDQQKSLLTGLPIDTSHNNMVPFFGSNLKQNVETFTNESILDRYTGKSNTLYKPKQETGNFFSVKPQDIYGTPQFTTEVEIDRFIPSIYRQNEKPFSDIKQPAQIAGTFDNNIRPSFPTIDAFRIGNRTQETYAGRTIAGQRGEVRGVNGDVSKNRPDTFYKNNILFTTTGDYTAPKSTENFSNFQQTNRSDYNSEYFGTVSAQITSDKQRIGKNNSDSLFKESNKTSFSIGVSNLTGNKSTNDYGKSTITVFDTQRISESPFTNVHQSHIGPTTRFGDTPNTTIKETTLSFDNSGYIKTQFDKGNNDPYNEGFIDISAPTTHKETTVINNYRGIANKEDAMGYLVNKYSAKTTSKELLTNASTDYIGNPEFSNEAVSRENYLNAEIRDTKEIAANRLYNSGPQKFNISGGEAVLGSSKSTPNMLLKEQHDSRDKLNVHFSKVIPTKTSSGVITKLRFDNEPVDTIDRLNVSNDIINQHSQNPYSIYGK